jgi:hypothetical protein
VATLPSPAAPVWAYPLPGNPYAQLAPPAAKRSSRTSKLLIALGVVVALGVVAAVVGRVSDSAKTQDAFENTSIRFPSTVADLNKITGSVGDQLTTLASNEDAACACGAHYAVAGYAEPGGLPKAIVVMGKFHVGDHVDLALQKEEDGFGATASHRGLSPAAFSDVDAGTLGGKMQCATTAIGVVPVTACVFADRAVVGSVLVYDRDGAGSQDLTLVHELRSAVEVRG